MLYHIKFVKNFYSDVTLGYELDYHNLLWRTSLNLLCCNSAPSWYSVWYNYYWMHFYWYLRTLELIQPLDYSDSAISLAAISILVGTLVCRKLFTVGDSDTAHWDRCWTYLILTFLRRRIRLCLTWDLKPAFFWMLSL